MHHISFIVAMKEEFLAIQHLFSKTTSFLNFEIHLGEYKGIKLSCIVSGIGKAHAAAATTLILAQYKADLVVNIGTCGGLSPAKIGDMVISNQAAYSDVDVSAFGYQVGQIPNMPTTFVCEGEEVIKIMEYYKTSKPEILQGLVTTSDSFISSVDKVSKIKDLFPQAIALEMEAAAIAHICYLSGQNFLLIKKVSDTADTNAGDDFKAEVQNMKEKTSTLIEELLDNI